MGASVVPRGAARAPEAALRRASKRVPRRAAGVNCSLGDVRLVVHQAAFPPMADEELRTAVQIEVEPLLPDVAAHAIDYHVIRSEEVESQGGRVAVLIVAAPKDVVDGRLRLLLRSGIDVLSVVPDSVALANVLATVHPPTVGMGVAVDVGFDSTSFVAIPPEGMPLAPVIRHIPDGLNLFVPSVTDTHAGGNVAVDSDDRLHRAQWSREIERSIQFATDRLNADPEELRVVGDFPEELVQWLSHDLRVTVRSWNPAAELARGRKGPDDAFVEQYGSQLAVALGLALMDGD